jgi:hypothetical protein
MTLSIISRNGWTRIANLAALSAAVLSIVVVMPFSAVTKASAAHPKADFNGDGYADLAIGVPKEGINGKAEAGLVNIIYGSASGLSATSTADQRFFQDYSAGTVASNIADVSEAGDHFGSAIATGDFNGDGYTDLAVGVPGEDLGSIADAGAVNVIYGSASGLSATSVPDQFWTQDNPGVEDVAESGDRLRTSLA